MAAKKRSAKKPTPNKSDFIRQQPATLSTAEVVAKGKAAGIKFSSQLVYHVRGGSKATMDAAKKTSTAPPFAAPSKAAGAESKAAFVRSRSHLSPREIVEDAKTAGLKVDVRYVYNARRAANVATKKKGVAKQPATPKPTLPGSIRSRSASSAETLLRAVAAEIGLGRAMEILAADRARVRAVLGG